jgi:hypothetical protein
MKSPLIFRESTHKRKKVGLVIFIIEPSFLPSPERGFHGEVKEAAARASLESNTPNNLLVIGALLVFNKEVVFE